MAQRLDGAASPEQKTDNAAKKDAVMNFMMTATPAEISTKVDEEITGTNAAEILASVRKAFKIVFIVLAYILRRI
jgi:hypothetical protein